MKFIFIPVFLLSLVGQSQNIQTVRGTLVDQDAQSPLIGATVQVLGSNPILGSVTDLNGSFRIEHVPIGRVDLLVQSVGYEERVIPNVLINSAKEVVLNLELVESIETLEAVVVSAFQNKTEVLNEMALVSARTFSVEETQRFAGSISDPARMVASFAGVTGNAEGNNDIVVRGNSSKGVLWRLEGIEIPNPNHFANEGATGGPVNALNSYMLTNSDFYTGAFAPQYGNALSGVFDMRFKNGNNEKREYTASASVFGIDFTGEGPFNKNYGGSFIANYRYSSLQLLSDAGILDFGGVPKYQDASFKVTLPAGKKHKFSLFGLGGLSSISVEEENDEGIRIYRGAQHADLGIIGLNHLYFVSNQSYFRNYLSISGTRRKLTADLPEGEIDYFNYHTSDLQEITYRFGSTFNHKINSRHKLESGFGLTDQQYDITSNTYDFEAETFQNELNDEGSTNRFQAFASWKYRISEKLTVNTGLHYLYFGLNNSQSLEPRFGLKHQLNKGKAVSLGIGVHSRLESPSVYLAKTSENGPPINQALEPSKAVHFVLGYEQAIGNFTNLKIETYYQHLYDIPIELERNSTFSMINETGFYIMEPLSNEGTGRNYGLELTMERFFNKGFYYLSTLSIYRSYYTPQDDKERLTAFAGDYVFNFLIGKEFNIGAPSKNRVMFFNTKTALIGGSRYTPINLEESVRQGTEVRDETRPFAIKGDDIFFLNFSLGTRRNKKRTTREFKIDINNITNNQGTVDEYYIEATEEIVRSTQLPFLPNIVYSIKF